VERERYIEIYKLRNTAHRKGRHTMLIGEGGIRIFPRTSDRASEMAPPPVDVNRRLSIGIARMDELLGGGLLQRSVTLVSGSAGVGKSTLGVQFVLAGATRDEPGLYIALEEGPAQILSSADALGLRLRDAVERGAVSLMYLSREEIRAAQLPSRLTEAARKGGIKRLVLDSASQIESEGLSPRELRQLLYELSVSLKSLGVTTLFTLESTAMYATDTLTDRGLSPIADNILLLRYAKVNGPLEHSITVVKTRGSAHAPGTFTFRIAAGGIQVGDALATTGTAGTS
jgi:circadian clock protein KaiC